MARGVRVWDKDRAADLFGHEPPPEPAPAPPPPPATAAPASASTRRPYSGEESRRLERVLDLFKDWLFAADLADLQAADVAALARRFPPMQEADVAEMVANQIAAYDRKDEIWRKWQRIR